MAVVLASGEGNENGEIKLNVNKRIDENGRGMPRRRMAIRTAPVYS